jgi:hypothetical protein
MPTPAETLNETCAIENSLADVRAYKGALSAEMRRAQEYERNLAELAKREREGAERLMRVRALGLEVYRRGFENLFGVPMKAK